MKQLCKNCGAKIPKNSDICKKCGEPYEYIDLQLDPETEELVKVEKPSNMPHICILLLSIMVFAYSLFLIYSNFSNEKGEKNNTPSQSLSSDDQDISKPDDQETPKYNFNAIDFVGQPFSAAKSVLKDQYSIKVTDDETLICYIDIPITLSTTDSELSENSIICSVSANGKINVTADITADMTFAEIAPLLKLSDNAPKVGSDSFYYAYKTFEKDGYQIDAAFKFDNDSIDEPPLDVILTCKELTVQKTMGIVKGLDEGSSLNMRTEPLYGADAVHQLYENDKVEILETVTSDDGAAWYKVMYDNSIIGYSIAEFITIEDNSSPASEEKTAEDTDSDTENTENTENTEDTNAE